MRYLVTGGSGFIGQHLIRKLSEDKNNELIVVDATDHSGEIKNAKFIKLDLTGDANAVLPDVDCVIHLAAILGVDYVERNPVKTLLDNISMFKPLQKYITKGGPRFVFFSTSEVYGDGRKINRLGGYEDVVNATADSITLPDMTDARSSYPLSKLIGEFLASQGSNSICLRPHNIYGPNMGNRHVIPQLITKIGNAADGAGVPVFNPEHSRSFCFITDAIAQILHWVSSDSTGVENIGNPTEPIRIADLFTQLADLMSRDVRITVEKKHLSSPSFRRPEVKEDLFSFTDLSVGLKAMVEASS